MKLYFSLKTFLEITSDIFVNLTSGYIAALLVLPPFSQDYLGILTSNIPLAILGLIISLFIKEQAKLL